MEENEQEIKEESQEMVAQGDNAGFKNVGMPTMWNDTQLMQKAWKMAAMIANTPIVPDSYKGNAGSCLIAIDIANRMGLSPVMVMQNTQVVRGQLTWKGSACKGLIDNCGRYKNTDYVFFGDEGTDGWGCYLQAEDKHTNKIVNGPKVTIKMAKDEGWYDKSGSKWKTMPELMLQYRAATFFARTNCPQSLMGFYTAEELVDIGKGETENETEKIKISLDSDGKRGE